MTETKCVAMPAALTARIVRALRSIGHSGVLEHLHDMANAHAPDLPRAAQPAEPAWAHCHILQRDRDAALVLVIAPEGAPIHFAKLANLIGAVSVPDAAVILAQTVFAPACMPPVGHAIPVMSLLDNRLQRHSMLRLYAGLPDLAVSLSPDMLEELTGAPWADLSHEDEK